MIESIYKCYLLALFYILGLGGPLFYVMLTHSIAIWSKDYVVLSVLPTLCNLPINFNFIFNKWQVWKPHLLVFLLFSFGFFFGVKKLTLMMAKEVLI